MRGPEQIVLKGAHGWREKAFRSSTQTLKNSKKLYYSNFPKCTLLPATHSYKLTKLTELLIAIVLNLKYEKINKSK